MLLSSEIVEQGIIPAKYTADNENQGGISPPLEWSKVSAAKSYAVTMVDPDLPIEEEWFLYPIHPGTLPGDLFIHWVIYDIKDTSLEEGVSPFGARPDGVKELPNSALGFGAPLGYTGPNPPQGYKAHKYIFTLYALDVDSLGISANATYVDFVNAIKGHIIAAATLTAYYGH